MICHIVKAREVKDISDKAILIRDYQGGSDIFPKSQVRHRLGNEYWVAKWILEQKSLCYSIKSIANVDMVSGKVKPLVSIKEHTPERIEPIKRNLDEFKR